MAEVGGDDGIDSLVDGLVLIADLVEERDLETDPGLIAELDAKIAEAQSLLVTIADYNSTLLQIGACETPLATASISLR